ncbi:hypothetical protein [Kitasatospora sp. NBC_01266]|uniref:hypothetical protein n=1 Tax=Kitasatospora sp. NBC_01266 TaxID=2903572 RepID=UPI002E3808F8|nr:hypothetical protein [Kitasatospora sp. NBC_01266]
MTENLMPEQQRTEQLERLYEIASRAVPGYAYVCTPARVRDALARMDELHGRRADSDDAVDRVRADLAALDDKDAWAAKAAVREGKPIPKATSRGPLMSKLAEAERAQLAVYQVAAEAAGAVRTTSISARPKWRADICVTAEGKRTEALNLARQLASLIDELASLADAVEGLGEDLGNPWQANERQWRIMAPRGGINWAADRRALDRLITDRLEYARDYTGGLPGRLDPSADPDTVHDPTAGPPSATTGEDWLS